MPFQQIEPMCEQTRTGHLYPYNRPLSELLRVYLSFPTFLQFTFKDRKFKEVAFVAISCSLGRISMSRVSPRQYCGLGGSHGTL